MEISLLLRLICQELHSIFRLGGNFNSDLGPVGFYVCTDHTDLVMMKSNP